MILTRMACPEDAPELVRLRRLMFAAMHGVDEPGPWEREAEELARLQLRDSAGDMPASGRLLGAFVVDGDEVGGGRLAACAMGSIEERLPAPRHPGGRFGFIFNVATDEHYRARGYARATTEALLDWFAVRGVTRVDLHATDEAEHLYRALGFSEHSTALSLDLTRRR